MRWFILVVALLASAIAEHVFKVGRTMIRLSAVWVRMCSSIAASSCASVRPDGIQLADHHTGATRSSYRVACPGRRLFGLEVLPDHDRRWLQDLDLVESMSREIARKRDKGHFVRLRGSLPQLIH